MIETLVQTVPPDVEASPVPLSITGISFENGNLARPRYPSLIDYEALAQVFPGLQMEPAFQIRSKTDGNVEMIFEIADEGIDFVPDGKGARCESILHPGLLIGPLISNTLSGKQCRLVWDQSQAKERDPQRITVLRLHCGKAGEPTPEEQVEGGIYIAILNQPRAPQSTIAARKDDAGVDAKQIRIIGFDSSGRPFYQLFKPMFEPGPGYKPIPDNVELEIAFRIRESVILEPQFVLDLPAEHDKVIFQPDVHGDVGILGHNPEGRPPQLRSSRFGSSPKICRTKWVQDIGRSACTVDGDGCECYCTHGHVSSFALMGVKDTEGRITELLHEGVNSGDEWKQAVRDLPSPFTDFDPTVIQPPVCTMINGQTVCTE